MTHLITMVCEECGSDDVVRDVTEVQKWSVLDQSWKHASTSDPQHFCMVCGVHVDVRSKVLTPD